MKFGDYFQKSWVFCNILRGPDIINKGMRLPGPMQSFTGTNGINRVLHDEVPFSSPRVLRHLQRIQESMYDNRKSAMMILTPKATPALRSNLEPWKDCQILLCVD